MTTLSTTALLQSPEYMVICEEELYGAAEKHAASIFEKFEKKGISRTQIKGIEAVLKQAGPQQVLKMAERQIERAQNKGNSGQDERLFWEQVKKIEEEIGKKTESLLEQFNLKEGTTKELKDRKEQVKSGLQTAFYTHFIYECYKKIRKAS